MSQQQVEAFPTSTALRDLDLTWTVLESALLAGHAEAQTFTPLDAPNAAGFARWNRIVCSLRQQLVPRGWTWDNPRNLPRVVHPDGRFAIIVSTGDEATGSPALPNTRRPKGIATADAIRVNEQLSFDLPDFSTAGDEMSPDLPTWMLLFHVTEDKITAELSLPVSMAGTGYIEQWSKRIQLPDIQVRDVEVAVNVDVEPGVDIPVERL